MLEIQIIPKEKVNIKLLTNKEYIAQELINSVSGIMSIVSQRHELRIYVFNGDIHAAYIRLPAKNSYLANISKGATEN